MFGICIFRRRFFPLGILRHISVFKTCRLSRQSLDTASFPARTLPSLIFSSMLFTFSLAAYSFVIRFFSVTTLSLVCQPFLFLAPNKHNWSCPSYFMCCCLSADQNLNVFSAAERSDIAENFRYPTLPKPKFRTKFVTSFSHQKCYNLENKKHRILENDEFFFGAWFQNN